MLAGAILAWGPFFLAVGLLLLAGFGLAMALPMGLACASLARRRGLRARRYGWAGAAYTLLFFLPGVYFAARLLDRRIDNRLVGSTYVLLYGFMVFGQLGTVTILFLVSGGHIVVCALVATFATMIVVPGCQLFRRYDKDNALPGAPHAHRREPSHILSLERVYLMPFLSAYLGMILIALFFVEGSPLAHL